MLSGSRIDRRKSVRVLSNGKFPGAVLLAENRSHVDATSIDVSRIGMAFASSTRLKIGTKLILKTKTRDIRLSVVTAVESSNSLEVRYGILLNDHDVNLEELFSKGGCLNTNIDEQQSKRTAPRFALKQELKLSMQTLGTTAAYQLIIENLSQSGLLVASAQKDTLPFRVNTLVEMIIDPECSAFMQPVRATGKIVRRVDASPKQNKVRFGLAVVDIEPQYVQAWKAALNALEEKNNLD